MLEIQQWIYLDAPSLVGMKVKGRDLPGDSVVKTLRIHCGRHGFHPWLRSLDPTSPVAWPKVKINRKGQGHKRLHNETRKVQLEKARLLLARGGTNQL